MFDSALVSGFVKDWGYLAVFLGSIVEGEVILLTASAFAAGGYLSIYKIFAIAFTTTVLVDQVLFFVGYKTGTAWLIRRFPKLQIAKERVFSLLNKMDIFFIFAFRFIYGIRTISPVIIGAAKINPPRFIGYNILSGFCWAFLGCFIGYVVADVFADGTFDTMPAVLAVSGIIAILGFGVFMAVKLKGSKNSD
ncbi:MAG: VTT domain-containing protein [Holosporales bacterium]|jgi:membrane protein DedA with SNARE-associated domain|nr:VTT domain-containing protein [Holosporales bacterium]